jgi:UDP-3-O-[3-hydroxymyristoyl] glucosamine N-acyltransferase
MPTLSQIASLLGCSVDAPRGDLSIDGAATLDAAKSSHVSFVSSEAYLKDLRTTQAAAVIVHKRIAVPPDAGPVLLRVDDPDLALAKVLALLAPPIQTIPKGMDRDARIDPTATLGEGAAVGPFVVIGARCRIGNRTSIHAGVHIGDDVTIGDDCIIYPNVVVRERITIGNRVIIHAGAIIGTDGFGYRWDGSRHAKIPQIGTVVIDDEVEIGSCTCIDRAKMGATRIGRGTKIDNLVQIAHNCIVGPHCVLAGQAGLAGSVTLGSGVVLGGQTAIADHLRVADGTMAAGCSAIATDIETKGVVSGMPALPHRQTLREQAAIRRLPELLQTIKRLEEEVEALRQRLGS